MDNAEKIRILNNLDDNEQRALGVAVALYTHAYEVARRCWEKLTSATLVLNILAVALCYVVANTISNAFPQEVSETMSNILPAGIAADPTAQIAGMTIANSILLICMYINFSEMLRVASKISFSKPDLKTPGQIMFMMLYGVMFFWFGYELMSINQYYTIVMLVMVIYAVAVFFLKDKALDKMYIMEVTTGKLDDIEEMIRISKIIEREGKFEDYDLGRTMSGEGVEIINIRRFDPGPGEYIDNEDTKGEQQ